MSIDFSPVLFIIRFYSDRLTHSERDIASKRSLIENYKTKLNEFETNGPRVNDRSTSEVIDALNLKYFYRLNISTRMMKNDSNH